MLFANAQKWLLIGALLLCNIVTAAQTQSIRSLLVAEHRVGEPNLSDLVRYNFKDGMLLSKDTVLLSPFGNYRRSIGYFEYESFIYQNRYVIAGSGHVVDLQTKKIILNERDDFMDATGDSLFFTKDKYDTDERYILNLKTGQYTLLKSKKFGTAKGVQSPDHLHGIVAEGHSLPSNISVCNTRNKCRCLVRNVFGTPMHLYSSTFAEVPLLWLDNSVFLYAEFIAGARVRRMNIHTGKDDIIAVIDSVTAAVSNASLRLNINGNIIFNCTSGEYYIDVAGKTAKPTPFHELGNGFDARSTRDRLGYRIRFNGNGIGDLWCHYYTAKTTQSYIAVVFTKNVTINAYPEGIMVWNEMSGKWLTIDIPYVESIIGWLDSK